MVCIRVELYGCPWIGEWNSSQLLSPLTVSSCLIRDDICTAKCWKERRDGSTSSIFIRLSILLVRRRKFLSGWKRGRTTVFPVSCHRRFSCLKNLILFSGRRFRLTIIPVPFSIVVNAINSRVKNSLWIEKWVTRFLPIKLFSTIVMEMKYTSSRVRLD